LRHLDLTTASGGGALLPLKGRRRLRGWRLLPGNRGRPANVLERGLPLILVGDGDVGGLIGIHCREETRLPNPIVSIDGIALRNSTSSNRGAAGDSGAVPV